MLTTLINLIYISFHKVILIYDNTFLVMVFFLLQITEMMHQTA